MKTKARITKMVQLIMLTVLFGAILVFGQGSMAYSEKEESVLLSEQVGEYQNNAFFADSVQSRETACGAPVYLTDKYYTLKTIDPVNRAYPADENEPAINTEMYTLNATDSTGTEVRLKPIEENNRWNNSNADTYAKVKIKYTYPLENRKRLSYSKDMLSLYDIRGDLNVPGVKTWVEYGKILWRSTTTGFFDGVTWNYMDLQEAELSFVAPCHVQIALIYEIKENGYTIFQANKYYQCVAWYNLAVVTR